MQSIRAHWAVRTVAFNTPPRRSHPVAVLVCLALSWGTFAAISKAQLPPVTVPSPLPSIPVDPVPGQPKVATVSFGPGLAVNARRNKIVFQQVGVQPLQVVNVTLQYPVALAGQIVAAEPLDGGRILTAEQALAVAADGTLNLSYEAGAKPGLYQIRLHYDENAIALQFWVFDAEHPENTPVVLTIQ